MKTFIYNDTIDKFIHQNKGVVLDCFEGCLLDNLLVECKRGMAAIYEKPLNCWCSIYKIVYDTKCDVIYDNWENFKIRSMIDALVYEIGGFRERHAWETENTIEPFETTDDHVCYRIIPNNHTIPGFTIDVLNNKIVG